MKYIKSIEDFFKKQFDVGFDLDIDTTRLDDCGFSGVFSTGATGAIAPVILRKRPIAPVILPGMYP